MEKTTGQRTNAKYVALLTCGLMDLSRTSEFRPTLYQGLADNDRLELGVRIRVPYSQHFSRRGMKTQEKKLSPSFIKQEEGKEVRRPFVYLKPPRYSSDLSHRHVNILPWLP